MTRIRHARAINDGGSRQLSPPAALCERVFTNTVEDDCVTCRRCRGILFVIKQEAALAELQVGDRVNYHAVMGGPATSTGHVVTTAPWEMPSLPGSRRLLVCDISGKRGWVAVAALSREGVAGG